MNRAEPNSQKNRGGRLEIPLSEGLRTRLASYASAARVGSRARALEATEVVRRAASAVGVGLVLTAGPASARIVYTPNYNFLGGRLVLPLDLNHDGINDFEFTTSLGINYFVSALGSNGVRGIKSTHIASALPAGSRIGPGSRFGNYGALCAVIPRAYGAWCGYGVGFLGLELTIGREKHFGWARLNGGPGSFILMGYAYETVPGKAIRAGQRGPVVGDSRVPELDNAPPSTATLQPATLGLLALGSSGLDIWRREDGA